MMMHVLVHDQNMLLHLEIQSKEDNTMPQRLLEYNILATREHKQPVLSCVIYLRKDRRVAQSPLRWHLPSGQETLAFHFQVIRLWEIPSAEIIETGLKGRFAMYEDIFEDSWVYQEIIGKGIQQQRAQEIQRQHQVLHFLLQRYFPDLLAPQHKEIETITDPEVLQNLIFKVGAAQTAQQAQHAIDAIRATHD